MIQVDNIFTKITAGIIHNHSFKNRTATTSNPQNKQMQTKVTPLYFKYAKTYNTF